MMEHNKLFNLSIGIHIGAFMATWIMFPQAGTHLELYVEFPLVGLMGAGAGFVVAMVFETIDRIMNCK